MHVRSQSDNQDGDDDDYEKQNVVLMMTIRIYIQILRRYLFITVCKVGMVEMILE